MKLTFSQPKAEVFIPDGVAESEALSRVKRMVVGAHQDDVEFMGFPLILDSYSSDNPSFCGVVMSNGAGSPRGGVYADFTDDQMQVIRLNEQRLAAQVGHYAAMVQHRFTSKALRDPANELPSDELAAVLRATRPEVVMTHNLADKHNTHIGAALHVIRAIRKLPLDMRPAQLLGGEIWRSLDWVSDQEKIRLDAAGRDALAAALMGVFDSQIAGGKRYDLATFGRRRANATYGDPHAVDDFEQVAYAIDMTPMIQDDTLSPEAFLMGFVSRFQDELRETLQSAGGM